MGVQGYFTRYWRDLTESHTVRMENARIAATDRAAEHRRSRCELCNGTAIYLCPICRERITCHSHEGDFLCEVHSFVNPIRQHGGARINGLGRCGPAVLDDESDVKEQA